MLRVHHFDALIESMHVCTATRLSSWRSLILVVWAACPRVTDTGLLASVSTEIHTTDKIDPSAVIPKSTMQAYQMPEGRSPRDFWVSEAVRVWSSLKGILCHLAVLKYMQVVQKHRLFAMTFVDVKNKKGTPLSMGINPRGLNIYRLGQTSHPVVKFSWAECSELSYTEKKFKIEVHDKETKALSVYVSCARNARNARIARRWSFHLLHTCPSMPYLAWMRVLHLRATVKLPTYKCIALRLLGNNHASVSTVLMSHADTVHYRYCAKAQICQRVLHLCIGLHRLYVQCVRGWAQPPPDMAAMRAQAVEAAITERENLKKEATDAYAKAQELKTPMPEPKVADPTPVPFLSVSFSCFFFFFFLFLGCWLLVLGSFFSKADGMAQQLA